MEPRGETTSRQFRVRLEGRVTPGFARGLTGVDQHDDDDGTVLTGRFIDESQLAGLLDQLRRLAIRVRAFEVDPDPGSVHPTEGTR